MLKVRRRLAPFFLGSGQIPLHREAECCLAFRAITFAYALPRFTRSLAKPPMAGWERIQRTV